MKTSLPRFIKKTSLPTIICITMTVALFTIMATTHGRSVKLGVHIELSKNYCIRH